MYEVTFAGFTRTPETVKKLKKSKLYRFKVNWLHFKRTIQYKHWYRLKYTFLDLLLNKNNLA